VCDAPITLRFARPAEIVVDGSLQLQADRIGLQSASVQITADVFAVLSHTVNWLADTLNTTARHIKQISETFSLHARGHQRHIEDMELVRVGHLDMRAREFMNLHAKHAVLKSTELVKIDGKQIQVG
jgi:Protein of unknown function (DUF3540)